MDPATGDDISASEIISAKDIWNPNGAVSYTHLPATLLVQIRNILAVLHLYIQWFITCLTLVKSV